MKTIKSILKLAIVLVLITTSVTYTQAEAPTLSKEQVYERDMNAWLDRLEADESGGNHLKVILDSNNKYSYGCLMFQMQTFMSMSKKYNLSGEMMDCKLQRALTKAAIKDDYKNWTNWRNSVTKKTAGYPPTML